MRHKTLGHSIVFFGLFLLLAGPAVANTIVPGSDADIPLNNGAFADGTNAAAQNTFNQEILALGSETDSADIAFSDIPYFAFGGSNYFQFVYDAQETGQAKPISIDDIVISVGATTVWDYAQGTFGSLLLNSTADETDSPLGNGGDMALYVPVDLFAGLGLMGSDLLTLTVTQSLANNGPDEWVVLGAGTFFGPNDPIGGGGGGGQDVTPVPEPGTVILLGSGLLGLFYTARRRNRK